jgi:hypothetical protein
MQTFTAAPLHAASLLQTLNRPAVWMGQLMIALAGCTKIRPIMVFFPW